MSFLIIRRVGRVIIRGLIVSSLLMVIIFMVRIIQLLGFGRLLLDIRPGLLVPRLRLFGGVIGKSRLKLLRGFMSVSSR